MNLKAYLPIIALCGLAFLLSFAAGLWWEIAQQEERQALAPSAKNLKPALAQPRVDKEKSVRESQTDNEQDKADNNKDRQEKPELTKESSDDRPDEGSPEPGAPPKAPTSTVPSNAQTRRDKIKDMSEEQRAKMAELRQKALETAARAGEINATGEVSSEPIPVDEAPTEVEGIVREPDNE